MGKNKAPRLERYCLYCKSLGKQTVEEEVNFLLACPIYANERNIMLDRIHTQFPSTLLLNHTDIFLWLMTQEDIIFIKSIGKFCSRSFENRD